MSGILRLLLDRAEEKRRPEKTGKGIVRMGRLQCIARHFILQMTLETMSCFVFFIFIPFEKAMHVGRSFNGLLPPSHTPVALAFSPDILSQ